MVGTSTIVHWCAHMGRSKCMRALKAGGADFELKDADGQVPFFYAKRMVGPTKHGIITQRSPSLPPPPPPPPPLPPLPHRPSPVAHRGRPPRAAVHL